MHSIDYNRPIYNFEIADYHFSVFCVGLQLREVAEKKCGSTFYNFFYDGQPEGERESAPIYLKFEAMPEIENRNKLFEGNRTLSVHKVKDFYWASYKCPRSGNYQFTAKISKSLLETIICHADWFVADRDLIAVNTLQHPVVHFLLMHKLAKHGGALIHAAGLEIQENGYVFAGESGAGKSTLTNLFLDSTHCKVLSDERIAIKKINGRYYVYGTPWFGDVSIADNLKAPLSGLFFISHGSTNKIKRIAPYYTLRKLYTALSIPWYDIEVLNRFLAIAEDFAINIPHRSTSFDIYLTYCIKL